MPVINGSPETQVRVLLIEDNPGDARLVKEILSEAPGGGFKVEWAPALMPGLARLAGGDIDMVLLDLSLPDSQGLESLTAIRTHAPNVPVVVLTGLDNQDFAQQAVRSGAQDYLVKGELDSNTFVRVLRFALLRQHSQAGAVSVRPEAGLGKVIGLLGATGGVGTTTIACHLSLELKRQTGSRVLLADLDVAGGAVGFIMKATSEYTIHKAANDLLRLDENYWGKIVVRGCDGLEIIPSQGALDLEEQANAERIRHVLRFTRSIYRWTVLDLGRLNPFALSLVPELTHIFLIVTLDVPVLYGAKRILPALRDAGMAGKQLCLVVNQVSKHPEVMPAEIGEMFKLPVYGVLPECRMELSEAYANGALLGEKSTLRRHIALLSMKIAELDETKSK